MQSVLRGYGRRGVFGKEGGGTGEIGGDPGEVGQEKEIREGGQREEERAVGQGFIGFGRNWVLFEWTVEPSLKYTQCGL